MIPANAMLFPVVALWLTCHDVMSRVWDLRPGQRDERAKERRLYQDGHYAWPGSCIIMALLQATVFSLGPVNWGVVYPVILNGP